MYKLGGIALFKKWIVGICTVSLVVFAIPKVAFVETVGLFYHSNVAHIYFAIVDVEAVLVSKGFQIVFKY